MYYIADYTKCYLKYYTLCDEDASYSDVNLVYVIKELMCGCDDNLQV